MRGTLLGQGRTAEVYAWDGQALKLFVGGFPVEWIRAEAEAARVACQAGLSAPAVGEIVQVDGRAGIIYECIDGASMLQMFAARPWTLLPAVRRFVELQIEMHNCAGPELPSQRWRLKDAIQGAPRLTA
ncbi:MAG: hypothetical protein AB8I69_20395 [Anaerolineae bacterium]|jgi:hypothetical protein